MEPVFRHHQPAIQLKDISVITLPASNPGQSQTSRKLPRYLPRRAAVAVAIPLLCTLILSAGVALAEEARAPNKTPAHIGNIWDGFDHQPRESQVQSAERAIGIAPSTQEQRREAQILQQLNQELLGRAAAVNPSLSANHTNAVILAKRSVRTPHYRQFPDSHSAG
jgi:hypothetical protein